MKVTEAESRQIMRLARSNWVLGISDAVLKNLDEETISRLMAGYLYLKAKGRPDKDFVAYLTTKETWSTLAIGLNVVGAVIPAMIFDEEFRALALKTGINKGLEIGSKTMERKTVSVEITPTKK